jgi:iron complex transport system substrate-binding protein
MKKMTVFWTVATLVMALAGSALAENVTVVDATGRSVPVPQPVKWVACTYGIGTFYVYALGAGDRLVAAWYTGIKSSSQAPASLRALEPRLDTLLFAGDPNVEQLAALGPDLVIADASRFEAFASQMEAIGVPTLLFAPETPQGVVDTALALGTALGEQAAARAARLAADFWRVYSTALAVASDVPASKRPRVLFVGSSPLQVASGAMYQTSLIRAAGGVSVSGDLTGGWNTVNLEQVLLWNPDVIIIPPYGSVSAVDLLANPDWRSVQAIQAGRVVKMPRVFAPMDTPLPESLLGVEWMSSLFFPESAAFDVRAEALAFYETYYDYALSSGEADAFLVP